MDRPEIRGTRAHRRRTDSLYGAVRGCFAQDDQSVANAAGATVRADINANLQALVSNSSGAAAPATTWAYQWWADTTTGLLKIRNAANSAWITVGTLSTLAFLMLSGGTLTGNLLFTDNTYDIGAAGATRPRDLHLGRNATIGGSAVVATNAKVNAGSSLSVSNGANADFTLSGTSGIVVVSSNNGADGTAYTKTVYAFAGRGAADITFTSLHSKTGGAGSTFTISNPSGATLRVNNSSGVAADIYVAWYAMDGG